jgi:DNA invertase Pin-like site-specific DNA recombinase
MPRLHQTGKTTAENRIQRVVGYARVATRVQAKHSLRLAEQRHKIEQHCASKDMEVVAFFVDAGLPGNPEERPEFQRMMSFVSAPSNEVSAVVISNSSRLTRDAGAYVNCLGDLEKAGVALVSAEQDFLGGVATERMMRIVACDDPPALK